MRRVSRDPELIVGVLLSFSLFLTFTKSLDFNVCFRIEYIGPLMQPWAAIACRQSDVERNDRLLKLHEPIVSEILRSSSKRSSSLVSTASSSSSLSSDSSLSRDSLASRFQALASSSEKPGSRGSSSSVGVQHSHPSITIKREPADCEDSDETSEGVRREAAKKEDTPSDLPLLAPGEEATDALFAFNAPVKYEYVELKPTAFLSIAASLTPYSNHNQSPR